MKKAQAQAQATKATINGITIAGQFISLTDEQMRALVSVIAPTKAKASEAAKPTTATTAKAVKSPTQAKAPEAKATAPKGAGYEHGQIATKVAGKLVTFTYGDSGKAVNDGRIYSKFKELGGVWQKAEKAYAFKTEAAAKKAAAAMDHYSAL